jgi:hypothetical protein
MVFLKKLAKLLWSTVAINSSGKVEEMRGFRNANVPVRVCKLLENSISKIGLEKQLIDDGVGL